MEWFVQLLAVSAHETDRGLETESEWIVSSQDRRRQWYSDRADYFAQRVIARLRSGVADKDLDYTVELVRMAGHFAGLVVGLDSLVGKQIAVMDCRVANAPIEEYQGR